MNNFHKFTGKGLLFPIQIDSKGKPVIGSGIELIQSSIITILSWPLNQRFFLPQFGSMLMFLLEEPNDDLLRGLVRYYIVESLRKWEPRIKIEKVSFETNSDRLDCKLEYSVINSEIEETFVYPFYRSLQY